MAARRATRAGLGWLLLAEALAWGAFLVHEQRDIVRMERLLASVSDRHVAPQRPVYEAWEPWIDAFGPYVGAFTFAFAVLGAYRLIGGRKRVGWVLCAALVLAVFAWSKGGLHHDYPTLGVLPIAGVVLGFLGLLAAFLGLHPFVVGVTLVSLQRFRLGLAWMAWSFFVVPAVLLAFFLPPSFPFAGVGLGLALLGARFLVEQRLLGTEPRAAA